MAEPTAGSPEWHRNRLLGALAKRRPEIELADRYYEGDHPLPELATKEQREMFRQRMEMSRTNWAALVVDAVLERLVVTGFTAPGIPAATSAAWQVWQRSGMDAVVHMLHEKALTCGTAYALVWPDEFGPTITAEDPSQTIVAYAPGSRRRVAALKHWAEDDVEECWLYLPGTALQWQRERNARDWTPGEVLTAASDDIPIVEFAVNTRLKPRPFGGGRSEFACVRPVIDRINANVLDRMFVSDFGAWPQKTVTGFALDRDEDGKPKPPPFVAAPNRVWVAEDKEARFGSIPAADLRAYIAQEDADIKALAAISRTPPYYLLGEMVNLSAEAIAASEAGLVKKAERHQLELGEAHEEALRVAARQAGTSDGASESSEIVWADAAVTSLAQRADAATKLKGADVPWRSRMRTMGFTPQQIDEMDGERTSDALTASLAAPAPATTGP